MKTLDITRYGATYWTATLHNEVGGSFNGGPERTRKSAILQALRSVEPGTEILVRSVAPYSDKVLRERKAIVGGG